MSCGAPVPRRNTFEQVSNRFRTRFSADANDYILQARTWERHDVGTTPGFGGDIERALRSIKVPLLYMPSETDLYFPVGDARYEAPFIPKCTLMPIPSLWGHTAGAASNPADAKFLNENIGRFLAPAVADGSPSGRWAGRIRPDGGPRLHCGRANVGHLWRNAGARMRVQGWCFMPAIPTPPPGALRSGTILTFIIIPPSSWSRIWQCMTNSPI